MLIKVMIPYAQNNWQVQNPIPTESYLICVEPITEHNVWLGGLGGTILNTNDAGKSWDVKKIKELVDIRDISFKDSLNGLLIDSEHLLKTIDGGKNWNEINIGADLTTYYFSKVYCFGDTAYIFLKPQSADIGKLITAKSIIFKSIDNGQTWFKLNQEIKGRLLSVHLLNSKEGFIYAEEIISINEGYNTFYSTTDGGITWAKQFFPENYWTTGMFFFNQHNGFIGKYRTNDGGVNWGNMFSNLLTDNENIEDIFFEDSINGWATSWASIFKTQDGGLTWEVLEQFGTNKLTNIDFSGNGTGWIVGWAGNILTKSPESDIWETINHSVASNLNDVFFIDENEGWCVGIYGTILHTSNGGELWEKQNSNIDSVLYSVRFLNDLEGWATGYYVLLHTTDGGKNWITRNEINGWFVDIDFFDSDNGLIIDKYGSIYRTTNGGINWWLSNEETLPLLSALTITNETEAWVGGWLGLVHITNKGERMTWYDVPNLSLVKHIQFTDNNNGFLTNDFAQFFKTTNGGWSWNEIPRGSGIETGPIQTFYMVDNKNGWIYWDIKGGYLKKVHIDHSITAYNVDQYSVSAISKMNFTNLNKGWAIGAGGTILKYNGASTSNSTLQEKQINVYPNPFDQSGTNISFYLKQSQVVTIHIFNSIGQKVHAVFSGLLKEGKTVINWKPNYIATGVYLILVHGTEFNIMGKCILMKN